MLLTLVVFENVEFDVTVRKPPIVVLLATDKPIPGPDANKSPPMFACPELTRPIEVFVNWTCLSTRKLFWT